MSALIRFCLNHARTVLLLLSFILVAGYSTYRTISREAFPDITIPVVLVHVTQKGISPEDAERLLVKPLEAKLQSLGGLKEIKATATEGAAMLLLEFKTGLDMGALIADVRQKVDTAKRDLPVDADDPLVEEVNVGLFPVLVVQLSGEVPLRTLYRVADEVKEALEVLPGVLKAPIYGKREEVIEVQIDPLKLNTYGISLQEVQKNFQGNNTAVRASAFENDRGKQGVKVSGLLEGVQDVAAMPLVAHDGTAIALQDVAKVRSTFLDPTSITRERGVHSVTLEVSKRLGENIIETVQAVRQRVAELQVGWQGKIKVTFSQDASAKVQDRLDELENSVILAILLVMAIIVFALGMRSAFLVGLAIPGAFLMGILFINFMDLTLNTVVLFSLILSVGMLVDGAIIVAEYADRKMMEGMSAPAAYMEASLRMAWPVISSLTTVIVVFLPLLYWPGIVGEFMKFLPMTLIATLTASLLMALVFIPVLGAVFGRVRHHHLKAAGRHSDEVESLEHVRGMTRRYVLLLDRVLTHPGRVLVAAIVLLGLVFTAYQKFGRGVEFFPDIEAEQAAFLIRARGNLSLAEKDRFVAEVEKRVIENPYIENMYALTGSVSNAPQDVIGKVGVEFVDWQKRPTVDHVLEEALQGMQDIPGIVLEVEKHKPGPSNGKPLSLKILGQNEEKMKDVIGQIEQWLQGAKDVIDINTTLPLPELEWDVRIDRLKAAEYGVSVAAVGQMMQLVTGGMKIASYRPDHSKSEVDIQLRFPQENRHLDQLKQLKIRTPAGLVPIQNFVTIHPAQHVSKIQRSQAKRYYLVEAGVKPGVLVDPIVTKLQEWIRQQNFDSDVQIHFGGEEEDKAETSAFLSKAFLIALFLIFLILVTQFNSFFSAGLVLSSVLLSTFGVLVGLLVMQQPFGIVMGGLGVIALSGIIVSNNIILIDTYDSLVVKGAHTLAARRQAILLTGAQRLRPVILTKLTTILGLLPIMMRMDINFMTGTISFGSPGSAWWVQLSTAIVFGVLFASLLTLFVTPASLLMRERIRARRGKISYT